MPLQFSLVCDLLDECQRLGFTRRPNKQAIHEWFARNRGCIDAHDTDLSALLSTLLPEKRTDRVFCIQAPRLEKIIARALMLGSSRVAELARYKKPGLGLDLADCVERILATTVSWAALTPNSHAKQSFSQTLKVPNVARSPLRKSMTSWTPWLQRSDGALLPFAQGRSANQTPWREHIVASAQERLSGSPD